MKYSVLLFGLLLGFISNSQNTVCLIIENNPNTNVSGLSPFTKYVNVLDCFSVYAESTISDAKVLHAAAVAAELLDNDENGFVDDPALKSALQSSDALIPIFSQENSSAENQFFTQYNGEGAAAVLYNNEMDPNQTGYWGSDATVEEVIHVINAVGHTSIYPNAFSIEPNSSLMSEAMDIARGGQFITVPNQYPSSAWYHYDDQTCDYGCMAIEYMYWSIVSWMGILDDPSTCNGIANEWEPCSPALFESTDVLMHALITDPQYQLPQLAPNGNYCPQNNGISIENNNSQTIVYPNTANQIIHITNLPDETKIIVKDAMGKIVHENTVYKAHYRLNVSKFNPGSYVITLNRDASCEIIKIIVY